MNSFLILLGICITALTPTIAIVVTRILDKRERAEVAEKVTAVAETAAVTATNVENVASRVEEIAVTTDRKMDEIKILVDGPLTRQMRASRAALIGHRVALAALMEERQQNGHEPTREAREVISELDVQIAELDVEIAERGEQAALAAAQAGRPAITPPPTERKP